MCKYGFNFLFVLWFILQVTSPQTRTSVHTFAGEIDKERKENSWEGEELEMSSLNTFKNQPGIRAVVAGGGGGDLSSCSTV
jgi:hypothetical protein